MGEVQHNIPWMDETDEWGTTVPSALVMGDSSAAVLVGIIIGVIVAVILLFTLALFIDCRTRKLGSPTNNSIIRKAAVLKRPRFPQFINNSAMNNENITFANQMCTENKMTMPPMPGTDENC